MDDKDLSEIMPEISLDLRIHKHKQSLKRGREPISTNKEKIILILKLKKQKVENPFHFNSNQTHDKNPLSVEMARESSVSNYQVRNQPNPNKQKR